MKIELSYSDSDRQSPYFEQLDDLVTLLLDSIPSILDSFHRFMEEHYGKKKKKEACS